MAVARHGAGARAALAGFASQVHPVFMLPPVAVSWFGAFLAHDVSLSIAAVHASAVFCAVYVAHVKDGYVDFHVRDEDDDHPLTPAGCRAALAAGTAGFAACDLALLVLAGPGAAILALPGWLVGYLHAPQLDTNPVTTTVGYPFGIAIALVGAYYAQTGRFALLPLLLAGVFLVALAGVKVIDDTQDYEYDRSVDKRTVAVVLGLDGAHRVGFALLATGLVAVLVLAALGVLPTSSVVAVFAYGAVAGIARRADRETGTGPSGEPGQTTAGPSGEPDQTTAGPSGEPDQTTAGPSGEHGTIATMLLVRGAYVFLALLVAAVWFHPMTGPLPDVTALGSYTYLATEVVFGAVALALLYRARALRTAAWTAATLYPVGYLWDWYTLHVGVFAIPARTGVTLLGIPIEEHLFILVVTGFIVAVHELRTGRTRQNTDS